MRSLGRSIFGAVELGLVPWCRQKSLERDFSATSAGIIFCRGAIPIPAPSRTASSALRNYHNPECTVRPDRISILTSRLGRLAVRGWEGGAVLVGCLSGSGVDRPGSGSIRAAGAMACSTGAIGSANPVVRDGLPYLTTAP